MGQGLGTGWSRRPSGLQLFRYLHGAAAVSGVGERVRGGGGGGGVEGRGIYQVAIL